MSSASGAFTIYDALMDGTFMAFPHRSGRKAVHAVTCGALGLVGVRATLCKNRRRKGGG